MSALSDQQPEETQEEPEAMQEEPEDDDYAELLQDFIEGLARI